MIAERVLITGCGGMLGSAIYPYFNYWYDTVLASDKCLTEDWLMQVDVRDDAHLAALFNVYRPDTVIHLAAETDLEYCETHQGIARDTNALATKTVARLCEQYGSTMVYISTAGVFDGLNNSLYTEDDEPNPIMVYGQTKHEGERYALENCSRTFVVRAGWMMGGGRRKEKKFIYKILQQVAAGRRDLYAVDDRWGTPTYTCDFAVNLFLLLKTRRFGMYHMVCEGEGTRYDVAREILKICKRPDITLTPVSSDFFRKEYFAPRPVSEMMCNRNLRELGLNHMRPWKSALRNYIEKDFPDYIMGRVRQPIPADGQPFSDGCGTRTPIRGSEPRPVAGTDRRGQLRDCCTATLEYAVPPAASRNGGNGLMRGVTVNVSTRGLCLYVFSPLNRGQSLRILNGPAVKSHETASVRWIRREPHGIYKAGLMFV